MNRTPTIGIALGGGAARGWAHIGVLKALRQRGIVPDVVSGASIGALIGVAFASDRLGPLEQWVRSLSRLDVIKLLDARLGGGVIEGNRVMQAIARFLPDQPIEALQRPFAAVATDLETGRPIWLRAGSTNAAVHASCAMPGLMPPRRHEDMWLVDGGLVDPVPVTLCRILGADLVIAVDLSAYRHRRERPRGETSQATEPAEPATPAGELQAYIEPYLERLQAFVGDLLDLDESPRKSEREPGLLDVVSASINIMQERITRSRLAGDPPDVELAPNLNGIGMMDFHKAAVAIECGMAEVEARADDLAALRPNRG